MAQVLAKVLAVAVLLAGVIMPWGFFTTVAAALTAMLVVLLSEQVFELARTRVKT